MAIAWLTIVACGAGAPTPVATTQRMPDAASQAAGASTPVSPEAPETAPASTEGRPPLACADPKASLCTPPASFVERLCAKPHQSAALGLFAPSMPFTRAYLRGRLDELLADEEVLVLRFHAPQKGGIVVGSGAGTYDLLRWDGTCSMGIEAETVTRSRPPRPRTAHIQWHRVATQAQDALIAASDEVKRAHSKRGKECRGAMSGDVSLACQKADDALVSAIVLAVRSGVALPETDDMP